MRTNIVIDMLYIVKLMKSVEYASGIGNAKDITRYSTMSLKKEGMILYEKK